MSFFGFVAFIRLVFLVRKDVIVLTASVGGVFLLLFSFELCSEFNF